MTWPCTALITGAGTGFGLAVATALSARGTTVVGLVRRAESAGAVAGRATVLVGDVTDPATERVIAAGIGPSLDLLLNNAGRMTAGARLAEVDPAGVLELVDLHCNGALRCTRAALPALRASGRATVVNVSSRLGSLGRVAEGSYDELRVSYAMRISKAALNMATACLARELAADGIAVHAVHPGRIRTAMASADADLEPEDAAARFLAWLDALPADAPVGCWDTEGHRLPW